MTAEILLQIRGLSRRFGRLKALNGLDMDVPKGSVCAFVGANGAGKTTTFAILGGFLRPNSGNITIGGVGLGRYRMMGGLLGLTPQDVQFFEDRTILRQLYLFARLAGLGSRAAAKEVDWVLEAVALNDKRFAVPGELSRGMRVRLGVAQALVGRPPLILLDEPTAGLDPKMQAEFRALIESIRGETTIVISSHDLRELESLCDYVCMIEKGKLLNQGPLKTLLAKSSYVVFVLDKFSGDIAPLQKLVPYADIKLKGENVVVASFDGEKIAPQDLNQVALRWFLDNKIGVISVEGQRSLEELFLRSTVG